MSKVVKSVGRAVGKVVKGIVTLKPLRTLAKTKIGKALLIAGAVYFGGAALTGAFSGATTAAGTVATGLEGAMAGIGNAWTSLGTAASQAAGAITGAEGASFANAGNALSAGFSGSTATMGEAGQLLVNGAVPPAAPASGAKLMPNGLPANPTNAQVNDYLIKAGQQAPGAGGGSPGLINQFMANKYAPAAAIQVGGQLANGLLQGYGAERQQKAAQNKFNTNMSWVYQPRGVA